MADMNRNKIINIKEIRTGLHILKYGRSPFWYLRLWDRLSVVRFFGTNGSLI